MNALILNLLDKMETSELQSFNNMTVLPFFYRNGNKLDYLTLDDALKQNLIEIKEVTEGGSVPELFVENKSDKRVLLLDGEELIGAKQNRILNATILLEKMTKTTIPVSCVEQNRWSYKERHFSSSEFSMPRSSRSMKMSSVSFNLKASAKFRADQGEVWEEVERISSESKVNSPTRAMNDIYEHQKDELEKYLTNFKKLDGQNGFFVSINNLPAGLEYISNETAFNSLFYKILRGYSMDAILDNQHHKNEGIKSMIEGFVGEIKKSEDENFKSVGLGHDHRLESPVFTASTLIVEEEIVHFSALSKHKQSNHYRTMDFIRRR